MARKTSIKRAAQSFRTEADEIGQFATSCSKGQSSKHVSWIHDHAVIRLYRSFETLMLKALVGAVNNDTDTISSTTGVSFPKHLTDEVCEYLVTGNGYFDFKGRDGLIKTLKSYVPADHHLVSAVKKPKYRKFIDQLVALRNFAAHGSDVAKARARTTLGVQRLHSSGAWLKSGSRLEDLIDALKLLAADIENSAPY